MLIFFIIKKFEKFKKRMRSELEAAIRDVLFKQKKLKKHQSEIVSILQTFFDKHQIVTKALIRQKTLFVI